MEPRITHHQMKLNQVNSIDIKIARVGNKQRQGLDLKTTSKEYKAYLNQCTPYCSLKMGMGYCDCNPVGL